MNELKLILHNFQSISDGELTFKTGLNFIIGQSNSGKSATFRALKSCLLNPSGAQRFIKRGTNKATVRLLYNGNDILWEKSSKENNYQINNQTYLKTGKSNVFKIMMEDSGFVQDDNGTIMNIEEELQLPFPFGYTPSELFKLFENVFCISDSAVILKSAKEYEKGVDSDIASLKLEKQKVVAKLKALEDFKTSVNIKDLSNRYEMLKRSSNKLEKLKDGIDLVKLAVRVNQIGLNLNETNFEDKLNSYLELIESKKLLLRTKNCHNLLKKLKEVSYEGNNQLLYYEEMLKLRKDTSLLVCLNKVIVKESCFNSKLEKHNEMIALSKIIKSLRKLEQLKLAEKEFESRLSLLLDLMDTKKDIKELKDKVRQLKKQEEDNNKLIKGIEDKLKTFKVCPLCHQEIKESTNAGTR